MFHLITFYLFIFTVITSQVFATEQEYTSHASPSEIYLEDTYDLKVIRFNRVIGHGLVAIIKDLNAGRNVPFIEVESFINSFCSDYQLRIEIPMSEIKAYIAGGGSSDLGTRQIISYAFGRNLLQKLQSSNCTYLDIAIIREQFRSSLQSFDDLDYAQDYFLKYKELYLSLLTEELFYACKKIPNNKYL